MFHWPSLNCLDFRGQMLHVDGVGTGFFFRESHLEENRGPFLLRGMPMVLKASEKPFRNYSAPGMYLKFQQKFFNHFYNWKSIAGHWTNFLKGALHAKSTKKKI